jgi:hypothetical protein
VSYVCGDEQPTGRIFARGPLWLSRRICRKLYDAYPISAAVSNLLVDAVCIDQQDGEEKARQVANMHEVYSRAARVLVWLDHEARNSSVAIEYILSLEYFLPAPSQLTRLRGIQSPPRQLENLPFLLHSIWNLKTLSRFNRLWIYQEVVLANECDVVYGQSKVNGRLFMRFAIKLVHSQFLKHVCDILHMTDFNPYEGFAHLDAKADTRRIRSTGHKRQYFYSVHNCRDRKTREPVDRLYALLGLDGSEDALYREDL